jgi:hypothetical protein
MIDRGGTGSGVADRTARPHLDLRGDLAMLLDLASFLDMLGPTGQLLLLLFVGVPVLLASVYLSGRAAAASETSRLVKERITER